MIGKNKSMNPEFSSSDALNLMKLLLAR